MIRFIGLLFLALSLLGASTKSSTANYIDAKANKILLTHKRQYQLKKQYLTHYFSPWSNNSQTISPIKIKQLINHDIQNFLGAPGFGENKKPHRQSWVKHLAKYANVKHLSKYFQKAITIHTTNVRRLPTNKPSFKNFHEAGQGYPFDLIQNSLLTANTPILVLHTSKDAAWSFVQSHFISGWIQSDDLAMVDDTFIKHWQTGKFISPIHRHIAVKDSNTDHFAFYARIGSILPLVAKTKFGYVVHIAVSDQNQHAVIKNAMINKDSAHLWPLVANTKNFASLSNNLLDEPYGWGGLYQDRDCSATIMDLFSEFGVWLPRGSKKQAYVGHFISLAGLSRDEKLNKLRRYGHGLTTLINLDGHVLLYLGERNGNLYVFHNIWGLQTLDERGIEGRDIIGQTVITTLTQGKNRADVPKTYLDKAYGLTLLD